MRAESEHDSASLSTTFDTELALREAVDLDGEAFRRPDGSRVSRGHWPSAAVQFAALAVLIRRADHAGMAWPGLDTIAAGAKVSRSTARNAVRALVELALLEDCGYLEGRRTPTYRVRVGWREEAPQAAPVTTVPPAVEMMFAQLASLQHQIAALAAGEPPAAAAAKSARNRDRTGSFGAPAPSSAGGAHGDSRRPVRTHASSPSSAPVPEEDAASVEIVRLAYERALRRRHRVTHYTAPRSWAYAVQLSREIAQLDAVELPEAAEAMWSGWFADESPNAVERLHPAGWLEYDPAPTMRRARAILAARRAERRERRRDDAPPSVVEPAGGGNFAPARAAIAALTGAVAAA